MGWLQKMDVSLDQIRGLVLEVFKSVPQSQYVRVCSDVAQLAVSKGLILNIGNNNSGHFGREYVLDGNDEDRVREIIWNLIVEGVLMIGINASNSEWPWLKLTDYGHSVVDSEMPMPHDPSGYLSSIKQDIPEIDELIITYMTECLKAYRINLLLSSTIMLGCASEKALLLLIDSFINSFHDEAKRKQIYDKFANRMIKRQFDELTRSLTTIQSSIPKDISDGLNNVLLGVFEMIRNYRNDAGHPTGVTISKEQVYANIQVFIPYLKKIYQLINFFKTL
ncbi:hypothetical protein PTQ21_12210 [Paenibacillus marchantiae]|uniref:hypothetical protein n=1 Tax=Paenibacillus marchantiae TaxID=3026433 RepID=UPI00237AE0D8|nr:hypothetical protein [Paenibacillus marchantiae]WDQ34953.1 hypothetical protein PTQ21_12210 [Paenibacillus marchantiae]